MMETESLKINATKYSGLPLQSLKFLVKTSAPVDKLRKREVWKEIYYRYFTQGREFNLYSLLRGEPVAFSNTIGWELDTEEVEIPIHHAEDFIKNLIDFIQYVEQKILSSDNLQFHWQLHELAGMQSMIERVRDAKIKDMNTRQKINLFIDKINEARRKALLKIEKAESVVLTTPNDTYNLGEKSHLSIPEEKTALSKQQLVHLKVAISKANKGQWMEMIKNLRIYYPEDQQKIIRHGVKKYPHDIIEYHPWQAFIENRDIRNPELNMNRALFGGIEKSGLTDWLQHLKLATVVDFLRYVKDWFFEAEKATEDFFVKLELELLREISEHSSPTVNGEENPAFYESKKLYNDYLLNELEKHYWIVERYENGNMSEMLDYAPGYYEVLSEYMANPVRVANLKYSRYGLLQFEMVNDFTKGRLTIIDLYYDLLKKFNRNLAWNEESFLRTGNKFSIAKNVPTKYYSKIKRFFQLPLTLEFDAGCALNEDRPVTNQSSIESVIIYKFIRGVIKTSELRWLYTSEEGYAFFKANTKVFRSSGMFHSHEDYVAEFISEVIPLFNFRDPDQLRRFFQLEFSTKNIYGPYPKIDKEVAEQIVRKLQDEVPHELQIVSEFFDGIDEEYTEFEVYHQFDGLSPIELLILQQQGIEIGKEQHYKGYKENLFNTTVHFTPDEARTRFIIDYYKNYYGA